MLYTLSWKEESFQISIELNVSFLHYLDSNELIAVMGVCINEIELD